MLVIGVTTQPADVPWHQVQMLNNALWQWAALLGVLIVTLAVGKIAGFLLGQRGRRMVESGRMVAVGMILRGLSGPATMLVFAGGLHAAGGFMNLQLAETVDLRGFWGRMCETFAVLAVGWGLYRLVDVLEVFLKRWTSRTRTQLDDQLVPIVRKAVRLLVVIILALFIASNIFQWDIGALLAGLGLGGLAIALAAQHAFRNFFGSVTIFADRPFQLGDRVKVGDHDGIVEEVGFRSTRLRALTGHLVVVPNAVMSESPVENVSRRPYIKRVLDVTVTYDTSPQKLAEAVAIIRDMLQARGDNFPPDLPGRVYFNEFNAESLNIVVYYWFTPPDWWEYLAFTDRFNTELLERFNAAGIEFAFPTRTVYVKQDSPLSAEVTLNRPEGEQGPAR